MDCIPTTRQTRSCFLDKNTLYNFYLKLDSSTMKIPKNESNKTVWLGHNHILFYSVFQQILHLVHLSLPLAPFSRYCGKWTNSGYSLIFDGWSKMYKSNLYFTNMHFWQLTCNQRPHMANINIFQEPLHILVTGLIWVSNPKKKMLR